MNLLRIVLYFVCLAICSEPTLAQFGSYPSKPIRAIVPTVPGGGADMVARLLSDKLSERLGQRFVVENRGGAGGSLGAEAVAKSPSDGYTLAWIPSGVLTTNPHLDKVPFDPLRDFSLIGIVAPTHLILVVHPSLPVRNPRDLSSLLKAYPQKTNYASTGSGSISHLTAEWMLRALNTKATHVPYKGFGPAMIDLIGGHTDFMFAAPASATPHVKSWRLRAIAVTSARRLSQHPDIPAIAESMIPKFNVESYVVFCAPARLPQDIIKKLATDLNAVVRLSDVKDRLQSQDIAPISSESPEDAASRIKADIAFWGGVVRLAGMAGPGIGGGYGVAGPDIGWPRGPLILGGGSPTISPPPKIIPPSKPAAFPLLGKQYPPVMPASPDGFSGTVGLGALTPTYLTPRNSLVVYPEIPGTPAENSFALDNGTAAPMCSDGYIEKFMENYGKHTTNNLLSFELTCFDSLTMGTKDDRQIASMVGDFPPPFPDTPLCTGFLIRRDLGITAKHCFYNYGEVRPLRGLDKVNFRLANGNQLIVTVRPCATTACSMPAGVLASPFADTANDFVLFTVDSGNVADFQQFPLATTIGSGVPLMLPGRFIVAEDNVVERFKYSKVKGCVVGQEIAGCFIHGCQSFVGFSGAPIFRRSSSSLEIVGIHSIATKGAQGSCRAPENIRKTNENFTGNIGVTLINKDFTKCSAEALAKGETICVQ